MSSFTYDQVMNNYKKVDQAWTFFKNKLSTAPLTAAEAKAYVDSYSTLPGDLDWVKNNLKQKADFIEFAHEKPTSPAQQVFFRLQNYANKTVGDLQKDLAKAMKGEKV